MIFHSTRSFINIFLNFILFKKRALRNFREISDDEDKDEKPPKVKKRKKFNEKNSEFKLFSISDNDDADRDGDDDFNDEENEDDEEDDDDEDLDDEEDQDDDDIYQRESHDKKQEDIISFRNLDELFLLLKPYIRRSQALDCQSNNKVLDVEMKDLSQDSAIISGTSDPILYKCYNEVSFCLFSI